MSENGYFEDCMVCIDHDGHYLVCGLLTRNVWFRSARADHALQWAIHTMAEMGGGKVQIARGEYPIHTGLKLASGVWLQGAGRSTRLLIHHRHESGIGIVLDHVHGVHISDLTVVASPRPGPVDGVLLDHCQDCTLRNVLFQGFARYGLWMRNHTCFCRVDNCQFADNSRAHIYLEDQAGGPGNYLITNCTMRRGSDGVYAAHINALSIATCQWHDLSGHAVALSRHTCDVLVQNCQAHQIAQEPVWAQESSTACLSLNIWA